MAVVTLAVVGCARLPAVGEREAELRDPAPGEETQGSSLVGAELEGMWQVLMPEGIALNKGALVGVTPPRAPADLVGQTFNANVDGHPIEVTIKKMVQATSSLAVSDDYLRTMDPSNSTWLYLLEAGGRAMCRKDRFGSRLAIAVDGWWDHAGAWRSGKGRVFTFGCLAGVIAKCYKWSYLPWLPQPPGAQPMTQVHWACTRAARADYCGDGVAHTVDDTPVDVWDQVSPPRRVEDATAPPLPDLPVSFEAAWGTRGALCITHPRWSTMPPSLCEGETSSLFGPKKIGESRPPSFCDTPAEANVLADDLFATSDPRAERIPIFIASDTNIPVP